MVRSPEAPDQQTRSRCKGRLNGGTGGEANGVKFDSAGPPYFLVLMLAASLGGGPSIASYTRELAEGFLAGFLVVLVARSVSALTSVIGTSADAGAGSHHGAPGR